MDLREEEVDYSNVEDLWSKNLRLKSQSDVSLSDKNSSTEFDFDCKENNNFSIAFEKLGLEGEESCEEMDANEISRETQTCHCDDCVMENCRNLAFKTREISTLKLVIQGSEVLNHQGIRHSPDDLAPFWKKDSRMWLWKSVRLARKRKIKSKSLTKFPSIDSCLDKS